MKSGKENELKLMREGLIKLCRYYDGSSTPKGNSVLWGYEQLWVQLCLNEDRALDEYVSELYRYLPDWFNNDNAPLSLKALLLNRYLHFGSVFDKGDFTKWFYDIYMAEE